MQNYATILGVVELRLQDVGCVTIQSRYNIGFSTVTLIMKRYKVLIRIMNHKLPTGYAHGRLPQHENIRGKESCK